MKYVPLLFAILFYSVLLKNHTQSTFLYSNTRCTGTSIRNQQRNQMGCICNILVHNFAMQRAYLPKHIAGIMLSAILSDALNLRSPTTTEWDSRITSMLIQHTGLNDVNLYAAKQVYIYEYWIYEKRMFISWRPDFKNGANFFWYFLISYSWCANYCRFCLKVQNILEIFGVGLRLLYCALAYNYLCMAWWGKYACKILVWWNWRRHRHVKWWN